MARGKNSRDKSQRASKRSSYDTYIDWVKKYGGNRVLTEDKFKEAYESLRLERVSEGKSTTNLARTLASEDAFNYNYKTGQSIKKAYEKKTGEKITISQARRIGYNSKLDEEERENYEFFADPLTQFISQEELSNEEIFKDADFWGFVSDTYNEYRSKGLSSKESQKLISQTIFGSP